MTGDVRVIGRTGQARDLSRTQCITSHRFRRNSERLAVAIDADVSEMNRDRTHQGTDAMCRRGASAKASLSVKPANQYT